MQADGMNMEMMPPTTINPTNPPNTNPNSTNNATSTPSTIPMATLPEKNIPTIPLNNSTIRSSIDGPINPITSRGKDTHRTTDTNPLHPSSSNKVSMAQKRVMDEYNRAFALSTDREKQLTLQYFMGLASIENELHLYLFFMLVLQNIT